MARTVSKAALIALAIALLPATTLFAQSAKVLSSEISVSRERAELKLELDNGNKVTLATVTSAAPGALERGGSPGDELITLGVRRGDAVDRSWRDLLNRAMDVQADQLTSVLRDWAAPRGSGTTLQDALRAELAGTGPGMQTVPAPPPAPGMNDSVTRLQERLDQLQEQLQEARSNAVEARRHHRGPDWLSPVRSVARGVSGIFATLITYAVLFGLGFVVIMFGGRKYIEGVADTARLSIGRSFLVGLAGSFLLLPVFVLGIIALAISIVGIPALLVWIPLFPLAAIAACLLGFLAVAHAAGESWVEKRYAGNEWISRANSYYFMATGLALLASLFIAAHIIQMAGPWLGFINGILNFFGVMLTWAAATTGFGAVLISRGGSRLPAEVASAPTYTEGANV